MISADLAAQEFGMISAEFDIGGIRYFSFKNSKSLTTSNTENTEI